MCDYVCGFDCVHVCVCERESESVSPPCTQVRHHHRVTSSPMDFADPMSDRTRLSTGITSSMASYWFLMRAISYKDLMETLPTMSMPGLAEPFSMPAARMMNQVEVGAAISKLKERSCVEKGVGWRSMGRRGKQQQK